MFFAPAEPD